MYTIYYCNSITCTFLLVCVIISIFVCNMMTIYYLNATQVKDTDL